MEGQKKVDYCVSLKTGSCMSCYVLGLLRNDARWRSFSEEKAIKEISKLYCPPKLSPRISGNIFNHLASSGMGQERVENTDWTGIDPIVAKKAIRAKTNY